MKIRKTLLADVLLLEPKVFEDDRGFFFESYTLQIFEGLGIPYPHEASSNAEIVLDTVNHTPEENARVIVEYLGNKGFGTR